MSGFTTFNAAGFGAGGTTGNIAFSYDPYYTSSVPTQNIPSGTTAAAYVPGSYVFNGSNSLRVGNPQNSVNGTPFSQAKGLPITALNGSGDFTVECWYYPNNASSFTGLITASQNNASNANAWALVYLASGNPGSIGWWYNGAYLMQTANNTAKINSWNHIAYVRSSGTGRLFVNGILATSAADANTYRTDLTSLIMGNFPPGGAGQIGNGFLSQPRITLSAVYPGATSFVPNPNLGVLADTTFYAPAASSSAIQDDFSPSGQLISTFVGATTYSAFAPANAPSSGMFLVDTTANIVTANSAAFTFGTGNFMVEYWINTPYTTSTVGQFTNLGNSAGRVLVDYTNQPTVGSGWAVNNAAGSIVNQVAFTASPNAWNHIAYGKSGANLTLWINGQQIASNVYSTPVNSTWFGINRDSTPGSNYSIGPVRVSNNAVYTTGTSFAPPTQFINTANTVFLLQGGANLSSYLTDRSVNAIAVSSFGNVTTGSAPTQYGISGNVIGDISGASNTGVILRASGTGTAQGVTFNNNYGGYWNFNGTTSNSAIQQTGVAISSAGNVSFSTWVQTSTVNNALLSFNNALSQAAPAAIPNSINFVSLNATGNVKFDTFTSGSQTLTGSGNIADNRWHHVVVAYNTSAQSASIYIDGQLNATGAITGTPFAMSGLYQIGSLGNGNLRYTGNIGPTAIYRSVLTAAQVQSIYSSQVGRFPAPGTGVTGSVTLSSTGTVQQFVVPAGVTSLRVTAVGGGGGQSTGASSSLGGAGANISANISVTQGQILYAVVGRGGLFNQSVNSTVAQGGGGAAGFVTGGTYTGGGGGFTGIFTSDPANQPSNAQGALTALLVAGGGGGTGGAGGTNWVNGGNAAVSLTGNAQPGGSGWYGTNNIKIQGFSSTGTTALVTLTSAIGNTTYTAAGGGLYSVGSPVGFSGVAGVTASNIYRVTAANATTYTVAATLGFNLPAAGNVSLSSAFGYQGNSVLYNNGTTGDIDLGGGGAWYSGGVAQPGWAGGTIDNQASQSTTIWGAAGNYLQGAQGGGSTATIGYGSGGGGGGYLGGGSGAGYAGGGGGGGNYGDPVRVSNVSLGTMTQTTTANTNGANGSMTISWATSQSATANYTYTTGTVQTFTVPPYVTRLNARVVGAAGAASANSTGGAGASISATLAVTPGQTLFLVVGQGGQQMATAVGNITANISQGAGGGSYINSGVGGFTGLTGGGFSGVFTSNPATAANATAAQASAVIVAGGGGAAGNFNSTGYPGGNASNLISANSRPGTVSTPSTGYLQAATAITSNGTAITATLNTGTVNKINYSVGEPISFVGASGIANTAVYYVSSATASTVIATAGPNGIPGFGTVSGTPTIYGGGNPGSVQGYNNGGGGWATPSHGGWQGAMYDGGTTAGFLAPNPGSALQGGSSGYNNGSPAWTHGGGGGGGWYGGGGGAAGGGVSGSGGGGSNYANSQLILTNTAICSNETATAAGGTAANGNIFLSW